MTQLRDVSSEFKQGLLRGDAEVVQALCRSHSPGDLFSKVDFELLCRPVLEHYFSLTETRLVAKLNSRDKWPAVSFFTPDGDFTVNLPTLALTQMDQHQLTGRIRVLKSIGRYLLALVNFERRTVFCFVELKAKKDSEQNQDNLHPCQWINLEDYYVGFLALSETPFHAKSDVWVSILGNYAIAQAAVCMCYTSLELNKIRLLFDSASGLNIDYSNSQILSISELSALEINANLAQVHLSQLQGTTEQLHGVDGLVALHAANSLYSRTLRLSMDIHSHLGFRNKDEPYGSAELCAGGHYMIGMLVSNCIVDRILD